MTARAYPLEATAPDTLHIDIAGALKQITNAPLGPMPHPEDALELQLLQAAKDCAAGKEQLPRRELVAVALREVERQEWWRDQAEEKVQELRAAYSHLLRTSGQELATLQQLRDALAAGERERAADLALHHDQRRKLLRLHFELVSWAALQLGCEPASATVMNRLRAMGSGMLTHDIAANEAEIIAFEVGHG